MKALFYLKKVADNSDYDSVTKQAYFDRCNGHVDVDFLQSKFTQRVGDQADVVEVVDGSVKSFAKVTDEAIRLVHQIAILGVAMSRVARAPRLRVGTQRLLQLVYIIIIYIN